MSELLSIISDFSALRELGYSGLTILIVILMLTRFSDVNRIRDQKRKQINKRYWIDISEKLRVVLRDVRHISYSRCEAIVSQKIIAIDSIIQALEMEINRLYSEIAKANVFEGKIQDDMTIICGGCKPSFDDVLKNRVERAVHLQEIINTTKGEIREHKKEKDKICKDLDIMDSILVISLDAHHAEVMEELRKEEWVDIDGANLLAYCREASKDLLFHNRQRIAGRLSQKSIFYGSDDKRYTLDDATQQYHDIVSFAKNIRPKRDEDLLAVDTEYPIMPFGAERWITFWKK